MCDARGGRSGVEPDSHLGHGVACISGCRPTLVSEYKTSKISKISSSKAALLRMLFSPRLRLAGELRAARGFGVLWAKRGPRCRRLRAEEPSRTRARQQQQGWLALAMIGWCANCSYYLQGLHEAQRRRKLRHRWPRRRCSRRAARSSTTRGMQPSHINQLRLAAVQAHRPARDPLQWSLGVWDKVRQVEMCRSSHGSATAARAAWSASNLQVLFGMLLLLLYRACRL